MIQLCEEMKFILPEDILKQHLIALGKTGSGKSSVLRYVVEHLLRQNKRVCIVDPKGDWWGLKLAADGKSDGMPVIMFGDFKEARAQDVPINDRSGHQLAELIAEGNRPCVIGMRGWQLAQMTRFWIDFASGLFSRNKGELYVVGDEFHNLAPKGQLKGREGNTTMCLHWSNRMLSEGRGIGIVCLLASQRPQKVHNDTLTSCETLFAMRVVHKSDRQAVKDWIDGCGDPDRGNEVLNSLAGMPRGEAFVWSPEINFGPERVKFPIFETFDSFAPPQLQKKVHGSGWGNVDLEAVKSKLASVIEEQKANDPSELKRTIGELKRKVSDLERNGAAAQQAEPIKVPVFDEDCRQLLDKVDRACSYTIEASHARAAQFQEIVKQLNTMRGEILSRFKLSLAGSRIPMSSPKTIAERRFTKVVRPAGDVSNHNGAAIGKGERTVLIVAAQYPDGVSDAQIAVMTGYKSTSRNEFKKKLLRDGLVERRGDTIVATDAGINFLGQDYKPLPTGPELRAHWNERLTGGEAVIFKIAVEKYPEQLHKTELQELTNYKATSVNEFCKHLAARKLITTDRGMVRAAENLFLEL